LFGFRRGASTNSPALSAAVDSWPVISTNAQVIQSADCFVDAQGVMYLTDNNAGLYILQFEGA
jgi:hypothetical protein